MSKTLLLILPFFQPRPWFWNPSSRHFARRGKSNLQCKSKSWEGDLFSCRNGSSWIVSLFFNLDIGFETHPLGILQEGESQIYIVNWSLEKVIYFLVGIGLPESSEDFLLFQLASILKDYVACRRLLLSNIIVSPIPVSVTHSRKWDQSTSNTFFHDSANNCPFVISGRFQGFWSLIGHAINILSLYMNSV